MKNVSPAETLGVKLNMRIAQIYEALLQHWHKLSDTQISLLLFLAANICRPARQRLFVCRLQRSRE